ncbi:nose resistant to fluoxetine 6-like [Paramuricea clavata]|uniref:Nose resistant to fluoxetine 6-like n=1 Tax=Paramuricea clavata TaxID=317549 RepID=A0A6S7JSU3_PARCT|nr:nose resistant to fluoxetine 6-like [Paramuricea clavata]
MDSSALRSYPRHHRHTIKASNETTLEESDSATDSTSRRHQFPYHHGYTNASNATFIQEFDSPMNSSARRHQFPHHHRHANASAESLLDESDEETNSTARRHQFPRHHRHFRASMETLDDSEENYSTRQHVNASTDDSDSVIAERRHIFSRNRRDVNATVEAFEDEPDSGTNSTSSDTFKYVNKRSMNETLDEEFLRAVQRLHNVSIEYVGSACPEKPSYTTDVVVTIVFCGFLLLLCLLGTTVDVFEWHSILKSPNESSSINDDQTTIRDEEIPFQASLQPYDKSTTDMSAPLVSEHARVPSVSSRIPAGVFVDFLRCFSLVRNATKIFSTNVPPKVITSINGLRVISMFWIILGHTFLFMLTSGVLDTSNLSLMVILNGYFSVDTFFFLSGLLLAYTCFRKLEKSEGKFNWFLFYFHRYVRLTPSLMFVILFYVKLKPFLAFSPLWTLQKDEHCSKYWWTNLIYINNFYPTRFTDECVGWTWYLANDMQFYIFRLLC